LITQNVDGLHERAGSRNVLRVHGSIWMRFAVWSAGASARTGARRFPEIPPRCECGGMLRPGVVWFGEALPYRKSGGRPKRPRAARIFFCVIGTSAMVYPAAGLAPIAKSSGARVVEINVAETALSEGIDEFLQGPSGELLPQLIA
jgi:NAD-dependent deacetylase